MVSSNAFIVPVTYFFYPETARRSLEEMDTIFHKTRGWFDVVRVAREEPHRYGEKGELLINYEDTAEHHEFERRRSSVTGAGAVGGANREKPETGMVENRHHASGGAHAAEMGNGTGYESSEKTA